MGKSILFVDTLAIQRCLALLEDRYRELRESGEKWSEAWASERAHLQQQLSAQEVSLHDAQTAREEHAIKMKEYELELSTLKREYDQVAEGKAIADTLSTVLQDQLTAQAASLQEVMAARDILAGQMMVLETELNTLKQQRESLLTGLQRLRQAASPASG
jgi:chromosome segregation ATPase